MPRQAEGMADLSVAELAPVPQICLIVLSVTVFDIVKLSHVTLNIPPSLVQPMKVVIDMSSLDLAFVTIMMCLPRFLRYKYDSNPVEPKRVEP